VYTLIAITFGALLLAFNFVSKKKFSFIFDLLQPVFVASIVATATLSFGDNGCLWSTVLVSFVVLHFILSRFEKLRSTFFPPVIAVLIASLTLLLPSKPLYIGEYQFEFNSVDLWIIMLLGFFLPFMINWLSKKLGRYLKTGYKNERAFSRALFFLLGSLLLFASNFIASSLGPILVYLGFSLALFYMPKSESEWHLSLAFVPMVLIPVWMKLGGLDSINFDSGRSMMGLVLGFGLSYFSFVFSRVRAKIMLANSLVWIIVLFASVAVIMAGSVNTHFGGVDSFVFLLVAFGLAAASGINVQKNFAMMSGLVAVGLIFIPMTLSNVEVKNAVSTTSSKQKEETKVEDIYLQASQTWNLNGNYTFDQIASKVTFELGPKGGKTKGAMEDFKGFLSWNDEQKQYSVKVEFKMKGLTTFNSYRDESLQDKGYFNTTSFPVANYEASEIVEEGSEKILKGKLTMLGKTLPVDVRLKQAEGENVLIGKAQFDRSKFGMTPDPKEGNVVDLRFQLNLITN